MSRQHVFIAVPALILVGFLLIFSSCEEKIITDLKKEALIPKPVSVEASGKAFLLTDKTTICIQQPSSESKFTSEELTQIGQFFAEHINPVTGFETQVQIVEKKPGHGNIYITLDPDNSQSNDEAYALNITKDLVILSATTPTGLFRGIQTIRQLLPPEIESAGVRQTQWSIATGMIQDYPNYKFRSSMLDVSRHFFGVDDIKRYIDMLAYYKMNFFHLHLSDDQGWRIEIKSWPKLTTHGGKTEVGGGEGGFLTQEQYTEIVNYAAKRYITIIPEIDMPGHTNAALSAYAELNCDGIARDLYTGIEVGFSSLCIEKDITYTFVDDVIKELAALTPGPYIHIGGDESHSTKKEDFLYFINRVQDIVEGHGKTMIGWDETSQANIKPGSVVQLWDKPENAITAIGKGAKIIMSPANKAYLDMQYDSTSPLGLHWAGYIEVDTAYLWDPATLLPGISKSDILGIEAPLWSETVTNMDEIEYLVFPRLIGYAELGWSSLPNKSWEEYRVRLAKHGPRMEAMGIDYYRSKYVPWVTTEAIK
jgi:hexosaminidase